MSRTPKLVVFTLLCLGLLSSRFAAAAPTPSLLDRTAVLPGFGTVAYRAPLLGTTGPTIVLFHGVYAGATHRAFRELTPLLDAAGAQVYLMDLPGVGQTDRPQRAYAIQDLDLFVTTFLTDIVRVPATVVTESLLGTSGLQVAQTHPALVTSVVLLSPTGVLYLLNPPTAAETQLYDGLYGNEVDGVLFYEALVSQPSVSFFLGRTFYDKSKLTPAVLADYTGESSNLGQRWISFSFVGGQLYRSFASVAGGVQQPVLALFGANAESVAGGAPETAADFQAIQPAFTYQNIAQCGTLVQREQPAAVAQAILQFVAQP